MVLSVYIDIMNSGDERWQRSSFSSDASDPATGLRAANALHRLAERLESYYVRIARERGWSWEQIGDALGVSRQSVHTKHSGKGGR